MFESIENYNRGENHIDDYGLKIIKLYSELRKNHLLNKANRNKINLREKYNNYQFNFNYANILSKIIFEEIYSMINFINLKHMDYVNYENILIHGKKFDYITYLKIESTTLAHQKNLFHGNEYKTFFKKRFLANAREQQWVLDNEELFMNKEALCNKLIEYSKANYVQLREIHLKQQGRLIQNLHDKYEKYIYYYDGNAYNNFISFLRLELVIIENILTITPMNIPIMRSIHKKNKRFIELAKKSYYGYILGYESGILHQYANSLQNIEPNYFRDYLFEIIRLNDLEKIWVKENE